MGWASGSSLLDEVAILVMPYLKKEVRAIVADYLIDLFENEDCDTIDECEQPDICRAWKKIVKERYGDD